MTHQRIAFFVYFLIAFLYVVSATCENVTIKKINLSARTLDQCPKNMQIYDFENSINSTKIFCDCKKRFLYYPTNDTCFEAYRQGPCNRHEYLILPEGENIAQCVKNPCEVDGMVKYNDTCYMLQQSGPCEEDTILDVNEMTFRIECVDISIVPFIVIQTPKKDCPAGSRRNSLGLCKQLI